MKGILVDSNIILDLFEDDEKWAGWSEEVLNHYALTHILYINPIIYAEVSIGFAYIEELEQAIARCGFQMLQVPKEALFLAGKAFVAYRKRRGTKSAPLPDFFIGAHAAVLELKLLTRDISTYSSYFPTVDLITPNKS